MAAGAVFMVSFVLRLYHFPQRYFLLATPDLWSLVGYLGIGQVLATITTPTQATRPAQPAGHRV